MKDAQLGPFTCCQDYNEKSCKREVGAIPIALAKRVGSNLVELDSESERV